MKISTSLAASTEAYVRHLEVQGKSPSTCATARRTLALLVAHLGAEREVAKVVVKDLDDFFASEAATNQRGRPRAAASIAQLRGIVRAAFAWWHQKGPGEQQVDTTPVLATPPTELLASATAPAAAHVSTPTRARQPQSPVAVPMAAPVAALPASTPARATYLDLTFQGQAVRFAKTEIDRSRLYGLRKIVAIDAEGHECQSALLTRDGRYVLPTGSTADLYINECGDVVQRRELVVVHEANAPRSTVAPTAISSLEIEGPITACELLDYAVTRVYALHPVSAPAKLARDLGAGVLFRVPYRLRPGATETPAFLIGADTCAFLILAEPHGFDFVAPDQTALPENAPEDEDIDAFAFPDSFGGPHVPA